MTHEQRARQIVDDLTAYGGLLNGALTDVARGLIGRISTAIAEASNEELERRRSVEQERDNLQLIMTDWQRFIDSAWLREFLINKASWSRDVFGNGARTAGICAHVRSELEEIEKKPSDLTEWVDVVLLAMDGFWRAYDEHHAPEIWDTDLVAEHAADAFIHELIAKQRINEARQWPAPGPQDQPIEHVREAE